MKSGEEKRVIHKDHFSRSNHLASRGGKKGDFSSTSYCGMSKTVSRPNTLKLMRIKKRKENRKMKIDPTGKTITTNKKW